MFICVSVNPAIDKRLRLLKLIRGTVNRAIEVHPAPGGKSVHVALALKALGADPLWVGVTGGYTGETLLRGLSESAIRTVAVPIQQSSRTNLEIIEDDGAVTEILEPGPALSEAETQSFLLKSDELFAQNRGSYVVLSGSLPASLPDDFYANLIRRAHNHNCKTLLDTSGSPLRAALDAEPDFVKPNREEAEWLTSSPITDRHSAAVSVRWLLARGAKSAAITLGKEGLVWSSLVEQRVFLAQAPPVDNRSAVGSGDSVLAAFASAMSRQLTVEETLQLAAACGAANCLAETPGLLKQDDVARLRHEVRITELPSR